jgi:hypothetical protein
MGLCDNFTSYFLLVAQRQQQKKKWHTPTSKRIKINNIEVPLKSANLPTLDLHGGLMRQGFEILDYGRVGLLKLGWT